MIVKLLTERHLEFLSITGGCRGPSESTLVKMTNCWKSRALAHIAARCETAIKTNGPLHIHLQLGVGPNPLKVLRLN